MSYEKSLIDPEEGVEAMRKEIKILSTGVGHEGHTISLSLPNKLAGALGEREDS